MNGICMCCKKHIDWDYPVCGSCYRQNLKAREMFSVVRKEKDRVKEQQQKEALEKKKKVDKWFKDAGVKR